MTSGIILKNFLIGNLLSAGTGSYHLLLATDCQAPGGADQHVHTGCQEDLAGGRRVLGLKGLTAGRGQGLGEELARQWMVTDQRERQRARMPIIFTYLDDNLELFQLLILSTGIWLQCVEKTLPKRWISQYSRISKCFIFVNPPSCISPNTTDIEPEKKREYLPNQPFFCLLHLGLV